MTFGTKALRLAYRSWDLKETGSRTGYTILLPVPHDLPVFLQVALLNIAAQDPSHLNEILVIPDYPSKSFRNLYRDMAAKYESLPLSLVEMGVADRFIGKLGNSPGGNHFLQLINGIEAASSTYLLFHDADLFLAPGQFLKNRYTECVDLELSALGVELPPHKNHNVVKNHMVATWELMVKRAWLLRFQPWEHKSQYRRLAGTRSRFDTTLWPQFRTEAFEFGRRAMDSFVHFGNVISTYRRFLKARKPYEDSRFKIFLIRLLSDAMSADRSIQNGQIPTFSDCVAGLRNKGTVSYLSDAAKVNYLDFRHDMESLLNLGVLPEQGIQKLSEQLKVFDEAFH